MPKRQKKRVTRRGSKGKCKLTRGRRGLFTKTAEGHLRVTETSRLRKKKKKSWQKEKLLKEGELLKEQKG